MAAPDGDSIPARLALPESAKGGYRWSIQHSKSRGINGTARQSLRVGSGGDHMLNLEAEAPGSQNLMKFAAAAVAMAGLAGCAIAVPLPPLATSFQDSRDGDFACKANEIINRWVNSRRFVARSP
jgi:hypothetical protein